VPVATNALIMIIPRGIRDIRVIRAIRLIVAIRVMMTDTSATGPAYVSVPPSDPVRLARAGLCVQPHSPL
jgi:hypothetical protein